jgi:hypothetical protein
MRARIGATLNAVCTIPRRNVLKSVVIAKHNTRI